MRRTPRTNTGRTSGTPRSTFTTTMAPGAGAPIFQHTRAARPWSARAAAPTPQKDPIRSQSARPASAPRDRMPVPIHAPKQPPTPTHPTPKPIPVPHDARFTRVPLKRRDPNTTVRVPHQSTGLWKALQHPFPPPHIRETNDRDTSTTTIPGSHHAGGGTRNAGSVPVAWGGTLGGALGSERTTYVPAACVHQPVEAVADPDVHYAAPSRRDVAKREAAARQARERALHRRLKTLAMLDVDGDGAVDEREY